MQTQSLLSQLRLMKCCFPHFLSEIPMNKIEVGFAPSPNLKKVQSKIGSLDNATYKPGKSSPCCACSKRKTHLNCLMLGGGNVKIESRRMDIKASSRIEANNQAYVSRGGDKKVSRTCIIAEFQTSQSSSRVRNSADLEND